jgi:hypothetical protein
MSSTLNYGHLNALPRNPYSGIVAAITVTVLSCDGQSVRSTTFKEKSWYTTHSQKGWRLHRNIARYLVTDEKYLTPAVWRKSQGPRLLRKGVERAIKAACEGHQYCTYFEIFTDAATDAVHLCWSSETIIMGEPDDKA